MNGLTEFFIDKTRQFYFSVPELYLSYKYDFEKSNLVDSIKVYVGRHIKEWNRSDAYWRFGIWNPLNRWEPLHSSENGLIGAFLDISSKNWLLEFYVGGINQPNINPKLKRDPKTGNMVSASRWGFIPPDKVDLGERKFELLNINYLVRFISEALRYDSYALSLKTWLPENQDIWIKGSFGYKPINDLFFIENSKDNLKVGDSGKKEPLDIQKNVSNFPFIQRILAGELGLSYGRLSTLFSISNNKVKPAKELPEGKKFSRKPADHTYISGLAKYQFPPFKKIKTNLQIGYLHSLKEKHNPFPPDGWLHYKFLRGVRFDWIAEFTTTEGLKREISFSHWQSFKDLENIFSMDLLYYLFPKWYVGGRVNFITGKKDEKEKDNKKEDFVTRFRSSDYISWRTGYVF